MERNWHTKEITRKPGDQCVTRALMVSLERLLYTSTGSFAILTWPLL
jgi:hypothetical protein